MRIYDLEGTERDALWLWENFGVDLTDAVAERDRGAGGLDLVELREGLHTCGVRVTVLDPDGAPMADWPVARWWPGSQPGELVPLPDELRQWHDEGLYGYTDANGQHTFFMGPGNAYDPSIGEGITSIWAAGNCQAWLEAGWVVETHYRHLDVVFQAVVEEEPPVEEGVVELLSQIRDMVRAILARMGPGIDG